MKPTVVITVCDGVVESVVADREVRAYVVDRDDLDEPRYVIGGDPANHQAIDRPEVAVDAEECEQVAEAHEAGPVPLADTCCGGSYNCTDCPKEREAQ